MPVGFPLIWGKNPAFSLSMWLITDSGQEQELSKQIQYLLGKKVPQRQNFYTPWNLPTAIIPSYIKGRLKL